MPMSVRGSPRGRLRSPDEVVGPRLLTVVDVDHRGHRLDVLCRRREEHPPPTISASETVNIEDLLRRLRCQSPERE